MEVIILETLRSILNGFLHPDQGARQLRAHATYCRSCALDSHAVVADGVAQELEAGAAPLVLNLAGQTLTTDGTLPEYPPENAPGKAPKKKAPAKKKAAAKK